MESVFVELAERKTCGVEEQETASSSGLGVLHTPGYMAGGQVTFRLRFTRAGLQTWADNQAMADMPIYASSVAATYEDVELWMMICYATAVLPVSQPCVQPAIASPHQVPSAPRPSGLPLDSVQKRRAAAASWRQVRLRFDLSQTAFESTFPSDAIGTFPILAPAR